MLNALDLQEFYRTKKGTFVRRLVARQLLGFSEKAKDKVVLGLGFAFPYLKYFKNAERSLGFIPPFLGSYKWPDEGLAKNRAAVSHLDELPLGDETVDFCILIHGLEFSETPQQSLAEIWRVLKPEGRLVVVVPNRSGLWARSDITPFGQGLPYSLNQIRYILREENFVLETISSALHVLPFKSKFMLESFKWMENVGGVVPLFPGLHCIEVSKKLYATNAEPASYKIKNRRKVDIIGVTPQPS